MSSTRTPNTSPCRSPQPAARTGTASHRSGCAVTTASTCSTGHGITLSWGAAGPFTAADLAGFLAINPSSTAAPRTADRFASSTRT